MLETQDHFISQIDTLEKEEDLNFEEAFKKVKENWRKDLTLSWKGEISLIDSTDLMRKMSRQIVRSNVLQSLKIVIPYVLIILIIANFSSIRFLQILFISALIVPLLYAVGNYIKHFKDFRLPKKHEAHVLTLHQDGIFMFFSVISPMVNVFFKIFSKPKEFQEMLLLKAGGMGALHIIFMYLSLILFFGGIAYSIVA